MTGADDDRLRAHGRLMSIVADLAESGRPAPCLGRHSAAWTAEDDTEATQYAASCCLACPALTACRQYVTNHPEPAAVYGGLTASERKNQK